MSIEIWLAAVQHEPAAAGMRRLTEAEVLDRVKHRRAGWLACELGATEAEPRIQEALESDSTLDAALAPRALDEQRIGIALDEESLIRLRKIVL